MLLLVPRSVSAADNLMDQHARLLERAILEDDAEQVTRLLATPYVNPNGWAYSDGRRVVYVNYAITNSKLNAAEALIKAGLKRDRIEYYAEPGQRFLPSVWSMDMIRQQRANNVQAMFHEWTLEALLKAGLKPQTPNELREYALFWLLTFQPDGNGQIDEENAANLVDINQRYGVRFSDAVKVNRWHDVLPPSIGTARFPEIRRVVGDFNLLDREGNSVLSSLLMFNTPLFTDWVTKILIIPGTPPPIGTRNSKGLYPGDFLWLSWTGPICQYWSGVVDAQPERQRKMRPMEIRYGPHSSWPRSNYEQCPNGKCTDCLGPFVTN